MSDEALVEVTKQLMLGIINIKEILDNFTQINNTRHYNGSMQQDEMDIYNKFLEESYAIVKKHVKNSKIQPTKE